MQLFRRKSAALAATIAISSYVFLFIVVIASELSFCVFYSKLLLVIAVFLLRAFATFLCCGIIFFVVVAAIGA